MKDISLTYQGKDSNQRKYQVTVHQPLASTPTIKYWRSASDKFGNEYWEEASEPTKLTEIMALLLLGKNDWTAVLRDPPEIEVEKPATAQDLSPAGQVLDSIA
jgi:hypothetical protein